jgi:hypothetical protein
MSFAPFQNIFRARDVTQGTQGTQGPAPNVNLFSSVTGQYSALIMASAMQLGGREVVFTAVYGQFDEAIIGGSANCLAANSFPDPTKQIVYFKGDDEGKAFFSTPDGPPNCDAFTHCIYVFDVQNNQVNIQGKTGVAYTISLDDATKISMQDLPSLDMWCKSKTPLASSARTTDSSTRTSNWVMAIILGLIVVLVLSYFFSKSSSGSKKNYGALQREITRRQERYASPINKYSATTKTPRSHNRVLLRFESPFKKSPNYNAWD